tara:strand:+ start:181 stop:720 length:540 start_codon:yes stop_codon:yes gene_type:complete
MFDQKTLVIALSSLAVGVAIGGAVLNSWLPAETASSARMGDVQFAQAQTEPQLTQAERDFMDFTMPDLSKPQAGGETTRHGCVKPPRPEWAINRTPQEASNALLLKSIYDMRRYQSIVETDSCPCEVEYPSWENADKEYQDVAAGKSIAEIRELDGAILSEVARLLKPSIDICRKWREQ